MTLPPFPVDDFTLDQLEHAMGGSFTIDEAGEHQLVGADFSMSALLDFLSGYDPSQEKLLEDGPIPVYEYTGGPLYTRDCVIQALIDEVRRLRVTEDDHEEEA